MQPVPDSDPTTPAAVTATAPAKINLHLAVGDARADGFHELVTVYQAVDLWETVTLRSAEADSLHVAGPDRSLVPTDRSNLAARAVDLVRERYGVDEPVRIEIVKGVPVAGGMAGGSADAAAALVAVEHLFGLGLTRDALEHLGAELGSDVPFCVRGGTVLGTGRGDELAPVLRVETATHLVVATAREGLSTPEVFAALDRLRAESEPERLRGPEELVSALAGTDPAAVARLVGNDLEAPALSLRPDLRRTLRAAREAGAVRAMVSGSGPTVLAFCATASDAFDVATRLAESGTARDVRLTRGPVVGAHVTEVR